MNMHGLLVSALILCRLAQAAEPAMLPMKNESFRPVYETVNDVKIETVLQPVNVTTLQECKSTVWRPVTETTFRDCSFTVCRPVTTTVMKEVCRTEMRDVCEAGTRKVCKTICEPVTRMQCVTRQVAVTECCTQCEPGGIRLGSDCGCAEKHSKLGQCWQDFGECLGNCGAKLGSKLANGGCLSRGLFVRMPERFACRIATRTHAVTEQVPVTTYVRRTVETTVPTTVHKKVAVQVVEKVPVCVTTTVNETVTRKVAVTTTRMVEETVTKAVPTCTVKLVPTQVRTCTPRTVVRLERSDCTKLEVVKPACSPSSTAASCVQSWKAPSACAVKASKTQCCGVCKPGWLNRMAGNGSSLWSRVCGSRLCCESCVTACPAPCDCGTTAATPVLKAVPAETPKAMPRRLPEAK